ncbi:MBL fold metallo-hydrolase [Bradyrhizobium sp. WBOS16]|uniref:MBL fold metallo-hydrolase n=1 Tax=Bradyrhizobium sp. WBOS16 TaxID=1390141 RepID=UPI003FCCF86A
MVDTGLGNDKQGRNVPTWNNRSTPFLETMSAAGFAPESIDNVLCTHLHVDHVGWNTKLVDGKWVPAFANARYVRQDRIRALARPFDRAGQGGGVQRFRAADRRCRPGRSDRERPPALRGDQHDPDPGPQSRPYEHSHPVGRRTGPAHRRRRPSPLPDDAPRLVLDRGFRPGAIGQDATGIVRPLCRHADIGDRRPFHGRPHRAGRGRVPVRGAGLGLVPRMLRSTK